MARLTIEQVRAPDLSAASHILENANQSFNRATEGASSLLASYQQGQQALGDRALLGQLAGLDSEEALNNFLQTTDLSQMDLSPEMGQNILRARETILGNNQTRQQTVNLGDNNRRANAAEGRTAAEYLDGVGRRNELREITGSVVDAAVVGRTYGTAGGAQLDEREILARTLQAEAGNQGVEGMMSVGAVIRNRTADDRFGGTTIGDVIMAPGQFSAWNSVTGYAGGEQGQDMLGMQVSDDAYAVADAILAGGYQDPTGGATHYYNPTISSPNWGGEGAGWTDMGDHRFGAPDGGAVSVTDPYAVQSRPITVNPAMGSPAQTALADALRASTYMTPDEALAMLQTGYDAQVAGQAQIDAAEASRVNDVIAEATQRAIQNPQNLTPDAVMREVMGTTGLSAADILAGSANAGQLAQGPFAGIVAPSVADDPTVDAALARAGEGDQNLLAANPTVQAFEAVSTFEASDDLGSTLLDRVGLTGDALEASGLDPIYVNRQITQLAQQANVTPAQAAAALAVMDGQGINIENIMIGGVGSVDRENVVRNIQRQFGPEAQAEYDRVRGEGAEISAQRESARLQLTAATSAAQKIPVGTPERADADRRVQEIRDTLLAQMTPQERQQNLISYVQRTGMASRLQGLDPESADFFRAMAQLEETIRTDPELSDREKELLIRDLRG